MESQNEFLCELSKKTARIEAQIESQKEILNRIEEALKSFEAIRSQVNRHDLVLKAATWFAGIVVSFFTVNYFKK